MNSNDEYPPEIEDGLDVLDSTFQEKKRREELWQMEQEEILARYEEHWAQEYSSTFKEKVKDKTYRSDFISRFASLDTWLLYKEALAVVHFAEPAYFENVQAVCEGYYGYQLPQVNAAVGFSLKVLNPDVKPVDWRVNPKQFIKWAQQKNWDLPADLIEAMSIREEGFDNQKVHGNTIRNAEKRQLCLQAAIAVMAAVPEKCKKKGKYDHNEIVRQIEVFSDQLFGKYEDPPRGPDSIRKYIKEALEMIPEK